MKNNSILSLIFWLLAVAFGILYFITDKESIELEAISETRLSTEKFSSKLLIETISKLQRYNFETGTNPRDVAIVNKMKENQNLLDSVRKQSQLDWNKLENNIDTAYKWVKTPSEVVYCEDCSSEKVKEIHQNVLYTFCQVLIMEEKVKVGDFILKFERILSLFSLYSAIRIYDSHSEGYTKVTLAPDFNPQKSYYTKFSFNERDTVVFKVVTVFNSKEREDETRYYQVIAKDKKGTKITSPFDYEQIKITKIKGEK